MAQCLRYGGWASEGRQFKPDYHQGAIVQVVLVHRFGLKGSSNTLKKGVITRKPYGNRFVTSTGLLIIRVVLMFWLIAVNRPVFRDPVHPPQSRKQQRASFLMNRLINSLELMARPTPA